MGDVVPEPLGTPEEFHRELVALATEFAPRRFAICAEYGERWDGAVVAWGMAFADRALFCLDEDPQVVGRTDGADGALRLLRRAGGELRLIWVDDQPPRPIGEEAGESVRVEAQ